MAGRPERGASRCPSRLAGSQIQGARLSAPLIEMRGITKSFGAVKANEAVDLSVAPGEILGRRLPEELDTSVSPLTPQAPHSIAQLFHLHSADAIEMRLDGEAIRLPDEAHWNDVTWITRPWIPASTQRVIADALAERLQ